MDNTTAMGAGMWASGHIFLAETLPPGALPLMAGVTDKLVMILDGSAERMKTPDGSLAWELPAVCAAQTPSERYVATMLWLAKTAKLYADTKVLFYVNKANNRDVRRVTARVINNTLN